MRKDRPIGIRVAVPLAGLIVLLFAGFSLAKDPMLEKDGLVRRTTCNPLSIPNYPIGRECRHIQLGDAIKSQGLWLLDHCEQFRELADPSVLWHDGKWYLYPSVDMAWVSDDAGATWAHHPLNIRDVGYAPTIVRHRGKFLLMASGGEPVVYSSDSPLGPFAPLGKIVLPPNLPGQTDPMLFSDDDGRLYYYWGCSPTSGIYCIELDSTEPWKVVGKPVHAIAFEPVVHTWQCVGEWNENRHVSWIEGAWMLSATENIISRMPLPARNIARTPWVARSVHHHWARSCHRKTIRFCAASVA